MLGLILPCCRGAVSLSLTRYSGLTLVYKLQRICACLPCFEGDLDAACLSVLSSRSIELDK